MMNERLWIFESVLFGDPDEIEVSGDSGRWSLAVSRE